VPAHASASCLAKPNARIRALERQNEQLRQGQEREQQGLRFGAAGMPVLPTSFSAALESLAKATSSLTKIGEAGGDDAAQGASPARSPDGSRESSSPPEIVHFHPPPEPEWV